jgi:hypothetical protein
MPGFSVIKYSSTNFANTIQNHPIRTQDLEALSLKLNYKYLGLTFCSSGSFMYAQEELYNKASKAYFKLSKDLLSLNPGLHTSMHEYLFFLVVLVRTLRAKCI